MTILHADSLHPKIQFFGVTDGILTNPRSLNSYSYAEDNPITRKDPDGHAPAASNSAIVAIYQQLVSILQSYISVLTGSGGGSGGGQSKAPVTNQSSQGSESLGASVATPATQMSSSYNYTYYNYTLAANEKQLKGHSVCT